MNILAHSSDKRRIRWIKPIEGYNKMNIDGSLRNEEGFWGAAIRNSDEKVVRAAHGKAAGSQ